MKLDDDEIIKLQGSGSKAGRELGTSSDVKGHLTGVTFPGGTTSYTYDIRGRLTQKQDAYTSGPTLTTSYTWNSTTGRLTSMTYPSGQVLNISYDSAGQVTGLVVGSTTLLSSIGYFPFGPPSGWTWGNTQTVTRTFDTDGRISGFPLGTSATRTLTYDAASRITNITDPLNSANNQTAGYDLLDRLTSWTGLSTNRSYGYDASSNRNALTIGASNYTYTVSSTSNRLTSTTGSPARSYTYDSSGNTTADGSKTWTFNDRGRMATAVISGNTATYTVNGLGERVIKSGPTAIVPAGTLYYAYDEAGHLTGEYDSSGNVIQEYAYLDDSLIGIIKGTTTTPVLYYAYTDQVGRPWVITDTSNNIVWSWDTAPFGENAPNQNPSSLGNFVFNLRFPGQYADSETGLFYNGFRDYNAFTGRYVESDPIGLDGGLNTYSYVEGSPLYWIDIEGLSIGEPGLVESFIPVWGSARSAINDFQCGRYWSGAFNTVMAITEATGVGFAAKGIAKGAWKTFGSHTWDATRKWYRATRDVPAGWHGHHWAISQNGPIGKYVPDVIKNQPWNINYLPSAVHTSVHGWGKNPYNAIGRWWHGTPTWAKVGEGDILGHVFNKIGDHSDCECEN